MPARITSINRGIARTGTLRASALRSLSVRASARLQPLLSAGRTVCRLISLRLVVHVRPACRQRCGDAHDHPRSATPAPRLSDPQKPRANTTLPAAPCTLRTTLSTRQGSVRQQAPCSQPSGAGELSARNGRWHAEHASGVLAPAQISEPPSAACRPFWRGRQAA